MTPKPRLSEGLAPALTEPSAGFQALSKQAPYLAWLQPCCWEVGGGEQSLCGKEGRGGAMVGSLWGVGRRDRQLGPLAPLSHGSLHVPVTPHGGGGRGQGVGVGAI